MTGRPYDRRAWRRLSAMKLRANPLCQHCLERRGRAVPAEQVNHIHELTKGGDLLPELDELESLCIPCHNAVRAGCVKGARIDGSPVDPTHWWNASDDETGGGA